MYTYKRQSRKILDLYSFDIHKTSPSLPSKTSKNNVDFHRKIVMLYEVKIVSTAEQTRRKLHYSNILSNFTREPKSFRDPIIP